jgi:DtxR family Mn-dependent transcriptional regulator
MSAVQQIALAELPTGKPAQVTLVGSQSTELLELLSHKNITLGAKLEVQARFGFDNSVEVKIKDMPSVNISEQLAKVLFVKPL